MPRLLHFQPQSPFQLETWSGAIESTMAFQHLKSLINKGVHHQIAGGLLAQVRSDFAIKIQ